MKAAINLRVSCWGMLLGVAAAGCQNFPQGQDSTPAPAAQSSSPSPPVSSRPSAAASAPSKGPQASAGTSVPAPQPAPPAPQPEPPAKSALQIQLAEAIRLYDQGEFYAAIGRFRNLPDIGSAGVDTQLIVLKHLAFSYCVTNRRTLCQQQFEAALRLDPKFQLAPAERGHPTWKVVFERAKVAVEKPAIEKPAIEKPAAPKPATAKPAAAKSAAPKEAERKSPTSRTTEKKGSDAARSRKGADKATENKAADPKGGEQQKTQDFKPAPN